MDLNALIKLLTVATPAGFQLIHIIRDKNTGKTTVMVLDEAITTAEETKALIDSYFATHPPTQPPQPTP